MAYKASEVIEMAQRFLVDTEDDAYSADMLSYLNEACRRFATETHCCQALTTVGVTGQILPFDTILSGINSSLQIAHELLYIIKAIPYIGDNYTPLPKAPISEMKACLSSSITIPTRYSVFAEKIHFDTHPNTVLDFNMSVLCSYVPVDIEPGSEDSNILIPAQWVQAIVKYIIFCCRIADRDAGLANGAYQEFEAIKLQAANVNISQLEKIQGAV